MHFNRQKERSVYQSSVLQVLFRTYRSQFARFLFMLTIALCCSLVLHLRADAEPEEKWDGFLEKYCVKEDTDRLIFVQYKGGSKCRVKMYKKITGEKDVCEWKEILNCKGYVGLNGLGKKREGDQKTPKGTFWIKSAFGILDDPGTELPYIKLNQYLYWSGEEGTYNTMVDSRKLGHVPSRSEHLISYNPQYNYALEIGYNRNNRFGKGSAIFLHCSGSYPYTGGCVAIAEKKMRKVMKNVSSRTRICIY